MSKAVDEESVGLGQKKYQLVNVCAVNYNLFYRNKQ